jgi:hypothetical protein
MGDFTSADGFNKFRILIECETELSPAYVLDIVNTFISDNNSTLSILKKWVLPIKNN